MISQSLLLSLSLSLFIFYLMTGAHANEPKSLTTPNKMYASLKSIMDIKTFPYRTLCFLLHQRPLPNPEVISGCAQLCGLTINETAATSYYCPLQDPTLFTINEEETHDSKYILFEPLNHFFIGGNMDANPDIITLQSVTSLNSLPTPYHRYPSRMNLALRKNLELMDTFLSTFDSLNRDDANNYELLTQHENALHDQRVWSIELESFMLKLKSGETKSLHIPENRVYCFLNKPSHGQTLKIRAPDDPEREAFFSHFREEEPNSKHSKPTLTEKGKRPCERGVSQEDAPVKRYNKTKEESE